MQTVVGIISTTTNSNTNTNNNKAAAITSGWVLKKSKSL